MFVRNTFAFFTVSLSLVTIAAAPDVRAADEKEACLSAADQGQGLRDDGRYLSAREQIVICSRDVCPKLVHGQCADWLRQIDEATPTVTFALKDDQGNDVASARVSADGKPIASSIDGKPVALDPGPHDFRFERDNPNQSVSVHVVLRAGEKVREVSAAFPAVEGAQPVAPTPPEAPGPAPVAPEKPPESSPPFWNGRSITAASLLGAGVVSVGLGVYFGLQSQSENDQAGALRGKVGRSGCPMPSVSTTCQQLSDTVDTQNRDAVLNEVLYVAGGVLAAGAVATWLLWPTPPEAEPGTNGIRLVPVVGPTVAGVRVGGAF